MEISGINIPNKSLDNFEIIEYVKKLHIPNFRGVFMRDTLPSTPHKDECGIVNFNTSEESGSHWVCYYKKRTNRIYFDSYGQITPIEIQNYLKKEKEKGLPVINRNTDIVQTFNTYICGHLCLFTLKALTSGYTFQQVLNYGYT